MAEYLAPGVYVEEIPSANKPIQAASTSTAAMVGMAERGPVGRPELVTSLGAYNRLFGGRLNPEDYADGKGLLPFAADGFFANGGSRLYVVRVVGKHCRHAQADCLVPTASAGHTVLRAPAGTGRSTLVVAATADLAVGDRVLVGGEHREVATIGLLPAEPVQVLHAALRNAWPVGTVVTLQEFAALDPVLDAGADAGSMTLSMDSATGLAAGLDLRLTSTDTTTSELVHVESLSDTTVTLRTALAHAYPAGSTVESVKDSSDADSSTALAAHAFAGLNPGLLELDEPSLGTVDAVLRLGAEPGSELVRVDAVCPVISLDEPLRFTHDTASEVEQVDTAFTVHARWPGAWGDKLRVTLRPAAVASTVLRQDAVSGQEIIEVDNALGIFPGTVLVFSTPGAEPGADTELAVRPVAAVQRDTGSVILAGALAGTLPAGTLVTSREFTLQVDLMEGTQATLSETFANLSLVETHPRFVQKIIGGWETVIPPDDDPLIEGGRPMEAGGSELIRVQVPGTTASTAAAVAGLSQSLGGGSDDAAGVTADTLIGTAAVDPGLRTGIQALENEPTLSLVAVPGITDVAVQQALVAHCEKMRYRFAVLDVPAGARLNDARAHRQNFDSTRAAIYYPDITVANPFTPGAMLAVPPSGHVLGVYARTDTTRGVHKAPANEVVVGALGLTAALTKGEQDILNPINLNVLRDFRSANRGIRVYGARVATSDPEFRYVNVRRLLLFIEQSLDTGLQWAVFEPNDTPLWNSVKQSATGFLDTVWRSGALEGTKQSEAFFVNIGYNLTMTQADIDNGLLVVEIGVAPVKPAEFVIVRISQKTREATA
ncbi:phage tail sheath protein [Glutamicibacter soli]|uniref:Phage tail sheath protein n=2 Tax=Glutamicibacter soli TaxID=453836 RepID=A0A6L9G6H7_9MICC|nr:phage tail sheath protein [Glutamicibacter soli]